MKKRDEPLFQIVGNIIMMTASLLCILPLLLLLTASLTDDAVIVWEGYSFLPSRWSLAAYRYLWMDRARIFRAYGVTVLVTAAGTCINLFMTTLLAWPLSRRDLTGRKFFSFFVFFTMLFNGGLVPTYLMYTQLFHIKNTIWALIVPALMMNAYYVIIMRTWFDAGIPPAVIESAQIDGAGEFSAFLRIVVPMGRPIIATVALFAGIVYWNDWYNGMIYLTDPRLFSIQNLLNRILTDLQFLQTTAGGVDVAAAKMPGSTIRMAIAVIGVIPIVVIYPFVQRNFVRGIAIGSVKG